VLDAGGLARGSCSRPDAPSQGQRGRWAEPSAAVARAELNEEGAGSAPTAWGEAGGAGATSLPAQHLSVCPAPWAHGEAGPVQAALVSLQGAALKYLPSILEDVFGIFDSSALG